MIDKDAQDPVGGSGGTTRDSRRAHLRILESMVYDGWQIEKAVFAQVPDALREIATDPEQSTRDRVRAMEALAHLAQQSVDAAVALDRIIRLDAGTATDRTEITGSMSDAQLAAVAATIAATKAAPSPAKPRRGRKRR